MRYSVDRKNLGLFLLKFAAFTLLFGFLWQVWFEQVYPHLLKPVAFPFFRLVGVDKWLLTRVSGQFANLVAFVALVLAAPRVWLYWRRTLAALAIGVAGLAFEHLLLSWAVYAIEAAYPDNRMRGLLVEPLWILNAALPVLLWLLFFHDRLALIVRPAPPEPPVRSD